MQTRPYVTIMKDGTVRLIEANNPAHVHRYIAAQQIVSVAPASAADVIALYERKVTAEKAEA